MRTIMTRARAAIELSNLELVYFIAYDPLTKKFGGLIGDKTNERDRLIELHQYCAEQLKHLPPAH